jgi:hypothetical protein
MTLLEYLTEDLNELRALMAIVKTRPGERLLFGLILDKLNFLRPEIERRRRHLRLLALQAERYERMKDFETALEAVNDYRLRYSATLTRLVAIRDELRGGLHELRLSLEES